MRTSIVRLEPALVTTLLLAMASVLQLARPDSIGGPDWWTFSQLGPLTRDVQYWFEPGAFDGNYWSVGYSAFVGLFLPSSESSTATLSLTQSLMAISMALMVYGFTFRFGLTIRIAALATAAISPSLYWMAWNVGYEIVLGWLICIAILGIWLQTSQLQNASPFVSSTLMTFSGLSLGLACIVASKTLLLLAALALLVLLLKLKGTYFFMLGAAIPVGLWSLRNLLILGSPSPLNRNGPDNFWIGNNPNATDGGFMLVPLPKDVDGPLEAALRSISNAPEFTVTLTLRKIARLMEPLYLYPDHLLGTQALAVLHFLTALLAVGLLVLFAFFLFGRAWVTSPTIPPVGILAFAYFFFFILHIPFLAEPRFRAPLEPILISVAIPTLFFLIRRIKRALTIHKQET